MDADNTMAPTEEKDVEETTGTDMGGDMAAPAMPAEEETPAAE